MKNNKVEKFKESFLNFEFLVIMLIFIASLICLIAFNDKTYEKYGDLIVVFFLGSLFLIILFVIGYFKNIKMDDNLKDIKDGKIKYNPYIIDINRFIEECKMGLMYSLVRINNEIYELEIQLDKVNSNDYDKFTCYINDKEITGIDNFLNYKFDGNNCLMDFKEIEFLEYNKNDPKEYFVNKKI